MSEQSMDLPPSKLSSAASRVWSESAGQFHKKTDLVKIDLGLQNNTMSSSAPNAADAGGTEKASTSITSGYVFGSRVFERVTKKTDPSENCSNKNSSNGGSSSSSPPKARPLDVSSIFRQMAQKAKSDSGCSSNAPAMWKTVPSSNGGCCGEDSKDQLSESANELAGKQGAGQQGQSASDDQLQQQQAIRTGEEEEQHLLQISCKFYQYNTENKQWLERGMGTLRVNQHIDARDDIRLVGRQSGSQRVLINSKIFPEMLLEELSEKRLKISAHTGDSDVPPQLFLVQASPASISQLQCLLRIHIEDSQVSKFQSALGCRKRRLSDGWEDLGGQDKSSPESGRRRPGEGTKKFVQERQPQSEDDEQEEEEEGRKEEEEGRKEEAEEEEGRKEEEEEEREEEEGKEEREEEEEQGRQ